MPMPPPPPPGGLQLGEPKKMEFKSNTSGDGRGLLLDSIRKGTKLKKTVTVDKSAPVIGKVSGSSSGGHTTSAQHAKSVSPPPSNSVSTTGANGQPLAGIFANGMPKLKPVGSRSKGPSQTSNFEQNSRTPEKPSPVVNSIGSRAVSNGSTSTHAKTKSNVEPATKYGGPDVKRGPPPQPPAQRSHMPLSASDSIIAGSTPNIGSMTSLSTNYSSSNSGNTLRMAAKVNSVTNLSQQNNMNNNNGGPPNQSALFANKSNLHGSLGALNHSAKLSTVDHGANLTNLVAGQKAAINHGKPNLAPKPPSLNTNAKPSVMRAHSMRSPRTPPITPPGLVPFGTLRGPPAGFHQSQDSIKMKPAPPIPQIGRPTIPPPIRPPANRPPPPPSRFTSATVAQSPISPKPATTIANNHQPPKLTKQLSSPHQGNNSPARPSLNLMSGINNTPMGVPPPPPPHRSQPAPPPPSSRQAPPMNTVAPTPPVRNSSMRNCNGNNNGNTMSAVIVDLESRFNDMFHSVNELPFPIQFCELRKTYNSKSHLKQSQQNIVSKQQSFSKPQAPLPPMQTPTIQLGRKFFSDESTDC